MVVDPATVHLDGCRNTTNIRVERQQFVAEFISEGMLPQTPFVMNSKFVYTAVISSAKVLLKDTHAPLSLIGLAVSGKP